MSNLNVSAISNEILSIVKNLSTTNLDVNVYTSLDSIHIDALEKLDIQTQIEAKFNCKLVDIFVQNAKSTIDLINHTLTQLNIQ